jgi:hypothetical protein
MSSNNGAISYQSIYVNSGITANVISATTISANTFFGGSLSASFIGDGDVNDQEFKYISGITSDTQTQINEKVDRRTNFLTYTFSQQLNLPFSKKLEAQNIELNETENEIEVSLPFNQTLFRQWPISVSTPTTSTAITNFNLSTLFNDSNRAVQIIIEQGNAVISGISGGTDGNILMITNTGGGLIILENESTKCTPNDSIKFKFSFGESFFLTYRKTVFLIYNSSEQCWKNINFGISSSQYDYVNDFNVSFDFSSSSFVSPNSSSQYVGLIPNIAMNTNIASTAGYPSPNDTATINNVFRTNFLDSNHVLKFSLPTNATTTNCLYIALHKPNRGSKYFDSNAGRLLNLYKFSLTSTTFDSTYNFSFGLTNDAAGRRINLADTPVLFGFRTPIAADINNIRLQTGQINHTKASISVSNTVATNLNLSSCLNSWCYAGLYRSLLFSGGTDVITFFTSTNHNEYVIDRVYNNSTPNYAEPFSMLRSNSSTNTNSIFLDTYYQVDSGSY